MKVLISDGHLKTSLSAVRSLGRRGVEAHVYQDRPGRTLCSMSRYCRRAHRVPPYARSDEFDVALESLLREERFDALLIASEGALRRVSANREAVLRWTRVDLPPRETVEVVLSKVALLEHAARIGISTPRTAVWRRGDPVEPLIERLGFPIVVKTGERTTYDRVRYLNDIDALRLHLERFEDDETVVLQDYVDGVGYGLFALVDRGRPLALQMHRRIWEYPVTGGPSVLAETADEPELREAGVRLLESLNWSGLAMVEFKRAGDDGRFVLMEVNPRLWGSLDLCVASGVDFPYLASTADREKELAETKPRPAAFLWVLPDAGLYLAARPSRCLQFLRYVFSPRVKTNLHADDVLPLAQQAREFAYWIRWLWRRGGIAYPQGKPRRPPGFAFDLHIHSRASPDCAADVRSILRRASAAGLSALAVTDHDSIEGGIRAAKLNDDPNLQVVVGSEIRTDAGDIVGLFLQRDVRSRDALDAVREIKDQGGIVLLPHPFSYGVSSYDPRLLAEVDLIEIRNGRTRDEPLSRIRAISREHGIPCVGSSDAHFAADVGVTRTVAAARDGLPLRELLRGGAFTIEGEKSPSRAYPMSQTIKAIKTRRRGKALFYAWWAAKCAAKDALTAVFGRPVGR